MNKAVIPILTLSLLFLLAACSPSKSDSLGYYGFHDYDASTGDTIYHSVRDFAFVDQDSQLVTNATFEDKVYIANFFFTSCPTICPKASRNMLRIYEKYADNDKIMLLSHTVDPKRDSVERLKKYANGLGVEDDRWRFVTGPKKELFDITYDYISTALDQPDAPGGIDHSGWILLVDPDRHLRAYANGTNDEKVTLFMNDIDQLLAELDQAAAAKE